MTGTITQLSDVSGRGILRNSEDGQEYPFERGSNFTVNFDMLSVGMRVKFSVVTYGEAVSAQNLRLI